MSFDYLWLFARPFFVIFESNIKQRIVFKSIIITTILLTSNCMLVNNCPNVVVFWYSIVHQRDLNIRMSIESYTHDFGAYNIKAQDRVTNIFSFQLKTRQANNHIVFNDGRQNDKWTNRHSTIETNIEFLIGRIGLQWSD